MELHSQAGESQTSTRRRSDVSKGISAGNEMIGFEMCSLWKSLRKSSNSSWPDSRFKRIGACF